MTRGMTSWLPWGLETAPKQRGGKRETSKGPCEQRVPARPLPQTHGKARGSGEGGPTWEPLVFTRPCPVACPAGKGPALLAPSWMSCWVGALPPNSWPARAPGSTGSSSWTGSTSSRRVREPAGQGEGLWTPRPVTRNELYTHCLHVYNRQKCHEIIITPCNTLLFFTCMLFDL